MCFCKCMSVWPTVLTRWICNQTWRFLIPRPHTQCVNQRIIYPSAMHSHAFASVFMCTVKLDKSKQKYKKNRKDFQQQKRLINVSRNTTKVMAAVDYTFLPIRSYYLNGDRFVYAIERAGVCGCVGGCVTQVFSVYTINECMNACSTNQRLSSPGLNRSCVCYIRLLRRAYVRNGFAHRLIV